VQRSKTGSGNSGVSLDSEKRQIGKEEVTKETCGGKVIEKMWDHNQTKEKENQRETRMVPR